MTAPTRWTLADGRELLFFSLPGPRTSGTAAERVARHAQAQTFAGDIRQRAIQLVVSEQEVASKITAATAGIATTTTTTFPETPSIDDTIIGNDNRDTGVRLVDVKQDGGTSPPPPFAPWDTPDGTPPPGTGLSPTLQQMILGGDPANLTGQGLADNVQRFVQSLPANDPNTAWLRGQVADLQAHVADIEYARTHCSTNDWIDRTAQFASGAIVFSIGVLTAETGAGVVAAAAGGVGAATAGVSLLQCLVGSK
ncbi:hypothetical protein [Mycobacterium tuberculosis]|uniref:hypothetical protein n=1 Tax=Mycobacterium tuberculosis TaxID=1773 RepID=UPI001927BB9F|nr:hypothetical protein [Mycobacterium tuberculosis]